MNVNLSVSDCESVCVTKGVCERVCVTVILCVSVVTVSKNV